MHRNIPETDFHLPANPGWSLGKEIHVWRWPAVFGDFAFLTSEEKHLAGKFRFEADRLRFSVARHYLRWLLSKYLLVDPLSISIAASADGKPFIHHPPGNFHFNVSHSGDWVLIALADQMVGVDLEKIDREFQFADLLDEHFSEAEKSFVLGSENPLVSFYSLWTRKEALIKSWGSGLQENLKSISVLDNRIISRNIYWNLKTLTLSENYKAAIAYQGPVTNIVCLEGSE